MSKPFENGAFDPETTQLLATAFERAWGMLQSSTHLTDVARTAATREALAKAVIAVGQRRTNQDVEQLANDALAAVGPRSFSGE